MKLKHKIFNTLKQQNGRTIEELSQLLSTPIKHIEYEIAMLYIEDWVEFREDGKIYLKIILDPIPETLPKDWMYEQLATTNPIPSSWMNPLINYTVHRDQGDRGTCVGQACATWFDLNNIKLTGDKPSLDDVKNIKRNVSLPDGVVIDKLVPHTFSAECIYQKSREIGDVTHPSGSYTSAGLRAMKEYGVCRETSWPTAKTPYAVYQTPPSNIEDEVKLHIIDGYASISTFDGVKRAIYEHGAVLGSIKVYDNYSKMQGGDGTFPSPTAIPAGAHALCWIGYDENNLYCLHSWGNWCNRLGKISRDYFNKSQLGFYTALDSHEVGIAVEKYAVVKISSNVDANIYFDGDYIGKRNVKASVLINHNYPVRVEYNGKEICDIVFIDGDRELIYNFPDDPWYVRLLKTLINWLR